MADDKAILVIGASDATGGAVAKRFAKEGYIECVTRRTADKHQPRIDEIRAEGGEASREDRETAKVMLPRGRGTIIFTGATASLRGREGPAAFAGAKHGPRTGPPAMLDDEIEPRPGMETL